MTNEDRPDFPLAYRLTAEQEDLIRTIRYPDGKTIGILAYFCGWSPSHAGGGHGPLFIAEDGTRITVPMVRDDLSTKSLRSNIRKVLRHRKLNGPPVFSVMEAVISHLRLDASRATLLRSIAADDVPVAGSPVESVPDVGGTSEPTPVVTPPGRHRKRRITKEEPWSAHRNQSGETYPSEAVMERQWNDGSTDYVCRWEGCEFTDPSPHSVSAHNGTHKRGNGRTPQPEVDGVDPNHIPGSRRSSRINKLRREVDGALTAAFAQSIDWSVVDQAEWIATWIIDHRVEPVRGTDDDAGELTTEQILDKIAALADRGRGKVLREQVDTLQQQTDDYLLQIDEAKASADAAQALIDAAQADRDAALAKASRVEGNLNALRDMLNETAGDPEVSQ